jgi:hypothetical protein
MREDDEEERRKQEFHKTIVGYCVYVALLFVFNSEDLFCDNLFSLLSILLNRQCGTLFIAYNVS